MADSGEKTEKATAKRREDERKKGHVFTSKDITAAISIAVSFFALKLLFPSMYSSMVQYFTKTMNLIQTIDVLNSDIALELLLDVIMTIILTAAPILGVCIAASVIPTLFQTRLLFSTEAFKFKMSNLNPLSGIKKLFSLRAVFELLKNLVKVIIVAAILYNDVVSIITELPKVLMYDLHAGIAFIFDRVFGVIIGIILAFAIISVIDFMYQRWQFEKDMMMTKQEIKEEYKQLEGDPHIKGKIKERQRQMATNRMMQKVPTADVVVRNPTHFAVAIKYDIEMHSAPIVVAKGADEVAFKIIKIAEENDVMVMENVPLARGLYAAVDLDMMIPPDFYQAVAEVLAWVFSVKKKDLKN